MNKRNEWFVARSCRTKKPYQNKEEAQKGAMRFRSMKQKGATSLHTYQCEICGLWHIGHLMAERGAKA